MPIATPQGTLDFKSVDTVTFVGASSNTVIDTTTGSLGVGVDGNGPRSNLHVVGHTRLEGDINMLHTSNTAAIKLNSNVVTEFPRSKKLIKYPRVALTQNDESGTSGYVASASATDSTKDPYRAFDNVLYSSWHEPVYQVNPYPNLDGAYTGGSGTVYDTNGYQGEYLQIQLPEKIKLYNYSISNRAAAGLEGRQPKDAKIFASNDGNTWIDIHTHSDGGGTYDIAGETRSFQLDNIIETHYKYYRLVINSIIQGGTSDTANISQWELFGIPEYDPDAHGVDVVVKSVPNVPNTDWLEVYYDAKDLADGAVTTVNDLKPSSLGSAINSSSVTNVSVSDEAFVFNGTSDIRSTVSTFTGDQPHTMSVWVNISTLHTLSDGYICILAPNTGETVDKVSSIRYQSDGFNLQSWGNDIQMYNLGIQKDRWYHLVAVYDGGGVTTSSKRLYIDTLQNLQISTDNTTSNTINFTNTTLSLGSRVDGSGSHLTGSIANFRLFNRALTSDEIYQLYAYQKEYFGHGDLSMTLKAGRLGIGTSEPSAALDVRGDIHGGCPIYFAAYNTNGASAGNTVIWNELWISRGGGYNTSTGIFTAPLAGIYKFYYTLRQSGGAGTSLYARVQLNGSDLSTQYGAIYLQTTRDQAGSTVLLKLNAGDNISIKVYSYDMASAYSSFVGEYFSSL